MQFKESYENDLSKGAKLIKPLTQNAMLLSFHLIEAVLAKDGLHVNKHQFLSKFLKISTKITIFQEKDREDLSELFKELEYIRPSRVYGVKGNDEAVKKINEIVEKIEGICMKYLEGEL
ncbi:MAG: hypothetical protein ACE5KT_02095 [Methanosarcinales archaeon]